jgi:enoyl-CoA hydratase/carnithine racemase
MPRQFVQYAIKDRIAYVTIDRPEVLNALHPPASEEMLGAFVEFRDDPDALVAIVTGTGDRAFCAGNDLKYHAANVQPGEAYPGAETVPFAGITSEFTCWKPIIAAVNGYCLGAGLTLLSACDIRVASETAEFGLPEVRRGIVPTLGATQRLPRQLPFALAMEMLLLGEHMSAAEAERHGLVNTVVPQSEVMETARDYAARFLAEPPLTVRAIKEAAIRGQSMPIEEGMRLESLLSTAIRATDDFKEGPKAFAEKREPRYQGR